MFSRLGETDLLLRRNKCRMGHRYIEFLGHKIAEDGRSPVPEYLERLKSFQVPRTLTELQPFIGALLRKCLLLVNLYIPCCERASVELGRSGQKAFEELRTRLVREPVSLAHPKWNKEFYVEPTQAQQGCQPSCHSWTSTPVNCGLSNSFRLHSVLVRRTTRPDSWRRRH